MKISLSARRIAASALLATGLAYPACATVCPKGIGGCPSPGRCFLFADADANALCDYTGRSGSQTAGGFPSGAGAPAGSPATNQTTAMPVPDSAAQSASAGQTSAGVSSLPPGTDASMSTLQNPSSGGILTTMHVSVPLAGVILFLIMTGVFFALFRSGVLGLQLRETRKALPLAAFFGLGTSLVLTCLLAGSMTAGTIFALIYMGAGTPLAAYLWHAGIMTRKAAMPAAALGALAGFVFLAPIMPMELGGIINVLRNHLPRRISPGAGIHGACDEGKDPENGAP